MTKNSSEELKKEELKNYVVSLKGLTTTNIDNSHFGELTCKWNNSHYRVSPKDKAPYQELECSDYKLVLKEMNLISTPSKISNNIPQDGISKISMYAENNITAQLIAKEHYLRYELEKKDSSSGSTTTPAFSEISAKGFSDSKVIISGNFKMTEMPHTLAYQGYEDQ